MSYQAPKLAWWVVARREVMAKLSDKAFWISTIAVIALMGIGFLVSMWFASQQGQMTVGVSDDSGKQVVALASQLSGSDYEIKEIPAELHHRATGKDLRGQLHRAAQLRDVVRALARKRHLAPDLDEDQPLELESGAAAEAPEFLEEAPLPSGPTDHDEEKVWTVVPEQDPDEENAERAERAEGRRLTLADLPVSGEFSDDETRALGDVDTTELDALLRDLPVDGDFAPDDVVYLAETDLETLAARLRSAPVEGRFTPEHAVIIASHLEVGEPVIPESLPTPLSPDEYTSLVVHAAVDAAVDAERD